MLADTGFDCEGNVGRETGGCGDFEEKESWLQPPSAPREIAIVLLSSDMGMMPVSIGVLKERMRRLAFRVDFVYTKSPVF
jgi:hypothetical protein